MNGMTHYKDLVETLHQPAMVELSAKTEHLWVTASDQIT